VAARFAFEGFVLDPLERRLSAGETIVDINGRYLDALALLVGNCGKLIAKDRFLDEVWRGVPVTDEALTQCIKTLRRKLGDDASCPRFIETVPKHGYRFIAPVEVVSVDGAASTPIAAPLEQSPQSVVAIVAAGVGGGAVAGILGGLVYGFAAASEPLQRGPGALSVLLVLLSVTLLVALIGSLGVSLGIALARLVRPSSAAWSALGGASGGLLVGAFGKLLGLDAFALLVGRSPGNITGAGEGAVIGAAVGIAAMLALRASSVRRGALLAAGCGCAAGALIVLAGGRLMLGSLELLSSGFPGSRLRLDELSRPFAEPMLNRFVHVLAGGAEVGLFAGCVVGAMLIAQSKRGTSA
jgi:DNA-binding winged helix-turn-helix (wHTH) protein